MHESHFGLSAAIQNCGFIALVVVRDRRILWANEAMHRLLAYAPGELVGCATRSLFVDDDDYEAFGHRLDAAIRHAQRFQGECQQRRKDGSLGWFEFSISQLEGHPETLIGAVVDRTEQREAVARLSVEASILAGIRDCVVVTSGDGIRDGVILYANTAFEAAFGYAAGELVGQHVAVLNAVTDQSSEAMAATIIAALRDTGEWQGDVLNQRKDGSTFWNHAKVSTYRTEAWGRVSISVLRDISDLRAAEAALRTSEMRYRALVESTSVITWTCPPSGLQSEPQPAWMKFTGQTAEEMLGLGWTKALHPDDLESVRRAMHTALATGVGFTSERRVRRHDGEWRWMRVYAVPIRNEAGELVEWTGTQQDITEQKRLEQAQRDYEERLEMALAASGLALWDWNITKREVFSDARWVALLGYPSEELGRDEDEWMALIHPKDLEGFTQKLKAHLAGESAVFYSEHRLRHRDMHWIAVEAYGRVTRRDKEGVPVRMVGTVADVTQEKRLHDEGVELLKRIETLIQGASTESRRDALAGDEKHRLTRRQRQILVMIASGMTSGEIGRRLNVATPTVVSHRRNLMARLGLHSAADVTRYAMTHGLLESP